jgi:hypothetical protein
MYNKASTIPYRIMHNILYVFIFTIMFLYISIYIQDIQAYHNTQKQYVIKYVDVYKIEYTTQHGV